MGAQHRAPRRPKRRCVVCHKGSVRIVCKACRTEFTYAPNHGVVFPIAMRGFWPEIGLGATVARAFRESA
jgi:hypothetical protein